MKPLNGLTKAQAMAWLDEVKKPLTTTQRVDKLRQEREALGLRRRELYAHEDDWPKLQELAAKLQRKRERNAKRAKG